MMIYVLSNICFFFNSTKIWSNRKKRIKEIAETRVRYGYRRIHVLLRREGWDVNPKRIYRLYKEMGLQLRNKIPKQVRMQRFQSLLALDILRVRYSKEELSRQK